MLTKAVCKERRQKSTGREACKPNVNGSIFLAPSFKYYFFILPQRFLSLPLRLSLFSDTKQATQNCHHHTNQICHHRTKPRSATTTPPLLLYLKLNHHTTTIDKIQETHTQNQSPRQKPRPNPHPNPLPPNPRNPYPKSIITTVKIHQAHGDRIEKIGKRSERKKKKKKKEEPVKKEKEEREGMNGEERKKRKGERVALRVFRQRSQREKMGEDRKRGHSMREK